MERLMSESRVVFWSRTIWREVESFHLRARWSLRRWSCHAASEAVIMD